MPLRPGTRIELHGAPALGVAPEAAKIGRWAASNGPRMDGWHIVKFADGGALCMNESRFRITDNRAA
jgi:hypothetical protein